MKLNFKYDLLKDFENYYSTVNNPNYDNNSDVWYKGIKKEYIELLKNKSETEAKQLFLPILKKNIDKRKVFYKLFAKSLQNHWKVFGKLFIKRFEKLSLNKFSNRTIDVYITTIMRCPYDFDEKWFMVSFLTSPALALTTIYHELMHFHFIKNNYRDFLFDSNWNDIKESLTVLINYYFKDLIFFQDQGYPWHKKFRQKILDYHLKGLSYNRILNELSNGSYRVLLQ